MDFSCGLHPDEHSPELAMLAESLGYRRVWVYDSPALGAEEMILEMAVLQVKPGRAAAFQKAFGSAAAIIASMRFEELETQVT